MRSAHSKSRLGLLVLSLGVLLAVVGAASALAGSAPSGVVETEAGIPVTSQTVTQTQEGDGLVTTTTEPEQLSTFVVDFTPAWTWYVDGTGDAAAYDIVATGLRTVYTAATAWNGSTYDLEVAKYVDGAQRWARLYNGPANGYDRGEAVAARGSAIYVAGRRDPSGADTGDVLLTRWDTAGNLLWKKAYDSGSHQLDEAVDVAVDGDGNVVVAGYSETTATGNDWVVISYRPDGTRRWVRRYDGPSHLADLPRKIVVDSSGRTYVAGYSQSATNGLDALVVKYSATGTKLWARRFNGSGSGADEALSLRLRPGGGVYVAGYTTSATTARDGLLLGFTGAGSRLITVAETGAAVDADWQQFNDVEVLPGGDIICAGYDYYLTSQDRFYVKYHPTGAYYEKGWRFSEWAEYVVALAKDTQGGIYLTGTMGTATGIQIFTQRMSNGTGTGWYSGWPGTPTGNHEPAAIATYGVNAYVAGFESYSGFDEIVLGYVY